MEIVMRWLVVALLASAALAGLAAAGGDMFPREEIIPPLPLAVPLSDDPRCKADSLALLANLQNSTAWAMRMWDSSAKGGVGLVSGSTFQLGDFDECLAQVFPVRAQYCLATLRLSLHADAKQPALNVTKGSVWEQIIHDGDPSKIHRDVIYWALCVPASCSQSDIEVSVNHHLAATQRNSSRSVKLELDPAACQTNRQEESLSPGSIAFCVVLGLIVGVVVGSTFFDFFFCTENDLDKRSNVVGYLLCFSLRKNFPEIARPDSSSRTLDCIYGLRALSILLIIVTHRCGASTQGAVQSYEIVERQYSQLYAVLIYKSDVIVDNFFVISGLLGTYVICLALDKKKSSPLIVIMMRYVRLTPVYAMVVFFYATLMYHLGEGPLWELVMGLESRACARNWWTNLLYINNYVNDDEMCMVQSWYLPCDMHYFVIAIFLVPLMHKRPKIALPILGTFTFVSALVPFLITFVGQKAPLLYFYPQFLMSPRTHAIFQTMYTKSHTRAGPYLVGMATGYFLYRTRSLKKTASWRTSAGMVVSTLVCCAAVLPATVFYDPEWRYDALQAALYAGVHRIAWAVGVAGFIVSIVFSESSLLGAVLSWSPWISLSKLSYCLYLVHMALQVNHVASMRAPEHFSVLRVGSLAFGDICWSLMIALVLYLAVEAPLRLVCKRIMAPLWPCAKHEPAKTLE